MMTAHSRFANLDIGAPDDDSDDEEAHIVGKHSAPSLPQYASSPRDRRPHESAAPAHQARDSRTEKPSLLWARTEISSPTTRKEAMKERVW